MLRHLLQTILGICALTCFTTSHAQITLNLADLSQYYTIGNVITENFDTLENTAMYNIGMPGGGNTWDFRNAPVSVVTEQQMIIAPMSAQGADNFPDATVSLSFDINEDGIMGNLFSFLKISASGIDLLGTFSTSSFDGAMFSTTNTYTPAQPALPLPLTFEDTWTYMGKSTSVSTLDGEAFTTEDDISASNEVDAYGTLIFPDGSSQQALRIRQIDVFSSELIPGFPVVDTSLTFLFIAKNGDILSVGADDHTAANQGMIAGSLQWNSSSAVVATEDLMESGFELPAIAPNPVSENTMISYNLPEAENVRISLFDMQGRMVRTLVNSRQPAGIHNIELPVNDLASGQYFLSLMARDGVITQKVIVQR